VGREELELVLDKEEVPGMGEVPDKVYRVGKAFPVGRVGISAQPEVWVSWVSWVLSGEDFLEVPEMEGNNKVPRSPPRSSTL
jgi:hypothetical protein